MNSKLKSFHYLVTKDSFHGVFSLFKKVYLTEKSVEIQREFNTVSFIVEDWINKTAVREAFEKLCPGNVISVHSMNMQGKRRNSRTKRGQYQTRLMGENVKSTRKKMLVKLESVPKFMEALNGI